MIISLGSGVSSRLLFRQMMVLKTEGSISIEVPDVVSFSVLLQKKRVC